MDITTYLTSPLFWLLAGIGVVLTGISKSGFAGGAGVVAVPLLALVMPIPIAVLVMLPVLLVMDARTVLYYRQHAHWHELKYILPAALIGIAIGGLLLGQLSDFLLQITLGILSILFAAWHKLTPMLGRIPGAAWLWGSLSGLTSTLIHAGGPPINIYLIAKQLPKSIWLATAGIFFAVMNLSKIIPYSLLGEWQLDLLWLSLALIPMAWVGVWLGHHIQQKFSEQHFMLACRGLLLASGLLLLVKAFW